ncbi:MAG: hypothetical protein P1V81_17095 [Planctomycetota bacterium]|nr:hypothetical protein [Planctomycetota bacterium]
MFDLPASLLGLPTRGPLPWTCMHTLRQDGEAFELVVEPQPLLRKAIGLPLLVGFGFAAVLSLLPDGAGGWTDLAVTALATALALAIVCGLWLYRRAEQGRGPVLLLEPGQAEPIVLPRTGHRLARADVAGLLLIDGEVELHTDLERVWVLALLAHVQGGELARYDLSHTLDGKGLGRLGDQLAEALGVELVRRTV